MINRYEIFFETMMDSDTGPYVEYVVHATEMREVLFMLAEVSQRHDMAWRWDAMSMVSKYAHYLEEK